MEIQLFFTTEEFDKITKLAYYKKSRGKTGIPKKTLWRILIPGIWQNDLNKRIFQETKVPCGFVFTRSYISVNEPTGYVSGIFIKLNDFNLIIIRILFTCKSSAKSNASSFIIYIIMNINCTSNEYILMNVLAVFHQYKHNTLFFTHKFIKVSSTFRKFKNDIHIEKNT